MELSVSACFLAQSNSKSNLCGYNSERIHVSQSDTRIYSLAYLLRLNLLIYLYVYLLTYNHAAAARR